MTETEIQKLFAYQYGLLNNNETKGLRIRRRRRRIRDYICKHGRASQGSVCRHNGRTLYRRQS